MKPTTLRRWLVLALVLALGAWIAVSVLAGRASTGQASGWRAGVSPGALSSAHASLANNCAACHTPAKGVEASSCIACHANEQSLLGRQPTAFHADVASCVECHTEHRGADERPTRMDHAALAAIGLRQLPRAGPDDAGQRLRAWQQATAAPLPPGHPVTPREAALNCATCHANQDRHRGFFGTSCVQCHATTAWSIPEFRHPSPASTSCAQCHQAPPSHYMEHFRMISMKAARQENAQVSECYKCHQTTSWNDIKGVGWYKHH